MSGPQESILSFDAQVSRAPLAVKERHRLPSVLQEIRIILAHDKLALKPHNGNCRAASLHRTLHGPYLGRHEMSGITGFVSRIRLILMQRKLSRDIVSFHLFSHAKSLKHSIRSFNS